MQTRRGQTQSSPSADGSTIGLGKAISIRLACLISAFRQHMLAVRWTPILGETAEGQKTTRSDPRILPATVIYDVDLTMTLPVKLSATSGG